MARLLLSGLLLAAGALAGCNCSEEAESSPSPRVPSSPARQPAEHQRAVPRSEGWPAAVIELSVRPAATRVTLRPSLVHINNEQLVNTWPAAALERAREAGEPGQPAWPRLALRLDEPDANGLRDGFSMARRAERASTGAGSGAAVVDLRVANDVPFEELSQILLALARAGYARPRLLLAGPGDELLALEWSHASSSVTAPSLAEIRAAMLAIDRGEQPELGAGGEGPRTARVRCSLDDEGELRVQVYVGAGLADGLCEIRSPAMIAPCVESLEAPQVSLEVQRDVPFGEVSPYWQHLSTVTDTLAIRSF